MLLMIDAGNTRIKWAQAGLQGALGAWVASGAVAHADVGKLQQAWQALSPPVSRVIVSNVAGEAAYAALVIVLSRALPGCPIVWFTPAVDVAGVRNGYRNPLQLGADRFAAAIGAHALFPGTALVVASCGTATTVDAVDPSGAFLGGMIVPGLDMMAHALFAGTAQLPQIAWRHAPGLPHLFADNTDEAIANGCLAAQCGAIEAAVKAQIALHGAATCVVSGGAAPAIASALSTPYQIVDNLVLTGLHAVLRSPPGGAPGNREP